MKLTKIQYKKLEKLMSLASKGIKLQIHVCNALHDREWLQMEGNTEKIWKVAHSLCEI